MNPGDELLDLTLPVAARPSSLSDDVFEDLLRAHQKRVFRVLLGWVRDPETADSLTQECFLRAYRARAGFRGDASPETWLLRIAVNLGRDHVKSRRTGFWRRLLSLDRSDADGQPELPEVADRASSPEQAVLAKERLARVERRVESLSPMQRAVFQLRFLEEMPLEEIARTLSLKVGTVKVHLARAVGALRRDVA
jgi:RNA polymerase sigma-70 factor (ECF subfamily)